MKSIANSLLLTAFLLLAASPAFSQEPPCSNLIVNGDFETDGGWHWGITPKPPSFVQGVAWDGSRSMLLGNLDPATDTLAFSSIWQDVTIPSDAASVILSFHYRLISSGPQVFDEAKFVLLNPADGSIVAVPWREKQATGAEWREVNLDLTDLTKENALRFYFGVVNDGNGNPTAMYIDDVRLLACSAPYVPTPTLAPLFTPELMPAPSPTLSPTPSSPAFFPSPTPPSPWRVITSIPIISLAIITLGVIALFLILVIVLSAARRKRKPSGKQEAQPKREG